MRAVRAGSEEGAPAEALLGPPRVRQRRVSGSQGARQGLPPQAAVEEEEEKGEEVRWRGKQESKTKR